MGKSNDTLAYYEKNADSFIAGTIGVEFTALQNDFMAMIPAGGAIIDLGCGSGRDSKAFIERGYRVIAVDGSNELAMRASEFLRQEVICSTFQEYEPDEAVDGVWACASLLHLEYDEIQPVVVKMANSLKTGGCFYASFKYGEFEGFRNGRYFTNLDEERFYEIVKVIPELQIEKQFVTVDARPDRPDEKWLNVFMRRI